MNQKRGEHQDRSPAADLRGGVRGKDVERATSGPAIAFSVDGATWHCSGCGIELSVTAHSCKALTERLAPWVSRLTEAPDVAPHDD